MKSEETKIRPALAFSFYLVVLLGFGILFLKIHKGHKISPFGDHGLVQYAVIHTLQKIENWGAHAWADQRIFYPVVHTLPFVDHYYFHSLIGSPYFLMTRDPLNTFVFIFFVQITIAIIGYYLFARTISGSLIGIIVSALYFIYLPAFYDKVPQVNLYGFLPWFFFFLVKLFQTGQIKYVYLSALAFLLQAAVSIHFEIFMLILTLALLPILAVHFYLRPESRKILNRKVLLAVLLSSGAGLAVLLIINQPYQELRRTTGQERPISLVVSGSAGPFSYLVPHAKKDEDWYAFSFLRNVSPEEKKLFLGRTGVYAILASLLLLVSFPIVRMRNNKKILFAALFLFAVFWILSLGPILKTSRSQIHLPYYYLYQAHFLFRSIRVPARFELLMALPVSIMILWWYDEIKMRQIPDFVKIGLLVLFGILLWKDIYRPWSYPSYAYVNKDRYIYDRLNRTPGEVLLELPSRMSPIHLKSGGHWHNWDDGYYMYMHIFHDKWIVNGESGHFPKKAVGIIQGIDNNYADGAALKKLINTNKIALILIHFKRIEPGYARNFDVLINNLTPFTRVVFRDQDFLLLAVRE